MKSAIGIGVGVFVAFAFVACDVAEHSEKIQTYRVKGTVETVLADQNHVVIDHEDIPGLMPGMTMSFDVPNPVVLAKMREGQQVEFVLELRARSFRIIDVEVLSAGVGGMSGSFGEPPPEESAPAFTLTDQEGEAVALADHAMPGSVFEQRASKAHAGALLAQLSP